MEQKNMKNSGKHRTAESESHEKSQRKRDSRKM